MDHEASQETLDLRETGVLMAYLGYQGRRAKGEMLAMLGSQGPLGRMVRRARRGLQAPVAKLESQDLGGCLAQEVLQAHQDNRVWWG